MSEEYESYITRLAEIAKIQQLPVVEQGVLLAYNRIIKLEAKLKGSVPIDTYRRTVEDFAERGIRIDELRAELAKHEPVSIEKPPKPTETVLLLWPDKTVFGCLSHDGDKWLNIYGTTFGITPTHWMPIPTLPKKESEQNE